MAKEKATLVLRIKRVWLEEIVFGTKRIEYRENRPFYLQRLVNKDPDAEVFKKFASVDFYCPIGQTGTNLRAEVEYKKTTYSEKSNVYEIHLGKILSHNLPKPKKT